MVMVQLLRNHVAASVSNWKHMQTCYLARVLNESGNLIEFNLFQ